MTFQQIYDRIVYKVWAETTVPSQTSAVLTGEFGMINNAHQKVQLEYDWWFQESFGTINTIAGQQSYTLFDDFKKIRSGLFKTYDEDYFQSPLVPVHKRSGEAYEWQNSNGVEYPTKYEIVDNAIILYPLPLYDDRALHILYWKMFPRYTNIF